MDLDVREQEEEARDFAREGPGLASLIKRRTPGLETALLVERLLALAEAVSGTKMYPYQKAFGGAVITCVLERQAEDITAIFSRQSGKSHTLAMIAASLMLMLPMLATQFPNDDRFCYYDPKSETYRSYNEGFWIGIFAPKRSQAGIIFSRVKGFFRKAAAQAVLGELRLTFDSNNGDTVRFSNGSSVVCSTASDQANIEGLTLHLGILDESQDISDERATKSIGPMLASTSGTIVKIGTTNARKSHFYNSVRRNIRRELEGAARCHFLVDWREAAKYNTFYEQFVKREMARLGESSDEFQMSYNCKFLLERGLAMTEELFNNRCVISGPFSELLPGPRKGMHYVAGIDFGKVNDSTVVIILEVDWDTPRQVLTGWDVEEGDITVTVYGKHVAHWMEMQGDDYEAQFEHIRRYLAPWGIERMSVDYTGVGVALGDRFKVHYPNCEVVFVPFAMENKDRLARQFFADLHNGNITWPAGPELQETREYRNYRIQMLDLEKEYRHGVLVLHHSDLRGAHDDYPDALLLADDAALQRPLIGDIQETDNTLFKR